jgi:hypothetical protein
MQAGFSVAAGASDALSFITQSLISLALVPLSLVASIANEVLGGWADLVTASRIANEIGPASQSAATAYCTPPAN